MSRLTRRQTLALIGGGVVVAGGTATATILAPNPHNRQPWLADLGTPDQVALYVDTNRLLPHTDPFNRQITIGLGCFLELMAMAAAQEGIGVTIDLFPAGSDAAALDARPVAIARFTPGTAQPDPLFAHHAARRTQKEPYDLARPVADAALGRIADAVRHGTTSGHTQDETRVQALRDLTEQALAIEIDTPHTYRESVDLFRIGKAEVNANPDGIDFSGPLFETLRLLGQFNREVALDTTSAGYAQGRAAVIDNTRTAMAHLWLTTPGNSRAEQIAAGRDWLRVHLAATAEGVALQPLSQALQEYPEMAELYSQVHRDLAPAGGTVQMLARLGYCGPVAPSPRWPIDAKVLNA